MANVGLALAVLVVFSCNPAAATARDEPVGPDYLTGYLRWKDGHGGISWAPDAPTDDPGGPFATSDAVEEQIRSANMYADGFVGARVREPPVVPFQSEALPKTFYINASRLVQVNLFFNGCQGYSGDNPSARVEIHAGTELFAGSADLDPIVYGPGERQSKPPSLPANYCLRSYRLPASIDVLPAGTTLTMTLHFQPGPRDFPFGLAGDHASVVHIPLLPPEEAVFRVPELASQAGPLVDPHGSDPETLLLALVPFSAVGLRRRAACALLAAAALSGCVDSATSPREVANGTARTQVIPDDGNATGLTNATTGSIVGQVIDPDGRLVGGAHVSLFGTPFGATTTRLGRFSFYGVPVGTHMLHVDREGFRIFETEVTVAPRSILKIDVPLVFVDEKVRDERWHRHDDWGGKTERPLHAATVGTPGGGSPFLLLPSYATVLPGTRELDITISWTMEWVSAVSVAFASNVEEAGSGNQTRTSWYGNGETIKVAVGWEMADAGHQKFSTWGYFQLGRQLVQPQALVAMETLQTESYDVDLVIRKGVVPFEEPHRDFWGDATKATVLKNVVAAPGPKGICLLACLPLDASRLPEVRLTEDNVSWGPAALVFPGTQWLEITLHETRPLVPAPEWQLTIKGAASRRTQSFGFGSTPCPATVKEPDARLVPPDAMDAATRTWTYRVLLQKDEPDPFYAREPSWCFYAAPADPDEYRLARYVDDSQSLVGIPNGIPNGMPKPPPLELTVTAHRTQMPTGS